MMAIDGPALGDRFTRARYERSRQRVEPDRGDLIDFPCSPEWVGFYAERGLTRDYPPEFYERRPSPEPDPDVPEVGYIQECVCGRWTVIEGGRRLNWPEETPHDHTRRSQVQPVQPVQPKVRPVPAVPSNAKGVHQAKIAGQNDQQPHLGRGGALLDGLLEGKP